MRPVTRNAWFVGIDSSKLAADVFFFSEYYFESSQLGCPEWPVVRQVLNVKPISPVVTFGCDFNQSEIVTNAV